MGSWNAGLYDSDAAADLKSTLALVCKVPGDGEQLFAILAQLHGPMLSGADDACTGWSWPISLKSAAWPARRSRRGRWTSSAAVKISITHAQPARTTNS